MTDPLTAASIATLIFTTAVGKVTEALTEDAKTILTQKLQALKQLIKDKFQGKAKAALASADKGDKQAIGKVSSYLDVEMDNDDAFAQQVRTLAQEIHQVINIDQTQGQYIQNISDNAKGTQVNNPEGNTFTGDGHTIHFGSS